MKGMQKRRVETDTNAFGLGFKDIVMTQDLSDVANFHGMRFCGSIEPENTDANANGVWAVWCLPGGTIQLADLPATLGALGNEDSAPYLWGLGCWTASNQAPYHFEFAPNTSRTCQEGARLVFRVINNGVSAGNVRVNTIITGFQSS